MRLLFPLLNLLFLASCTSVTQLMEEGRYAEAYVLAAKPCTRARAHQRPLKPRQLLKLQAAYAAVQASDLDRVTAQETTNLPGSWPGRYLLYTALHERSREYAQLVPLAEQRIRLNLRPSYLTKKRETARLQAGLYYLDQATPSLPAARAGDKDAARDAFYDVEAALDFLPEQADKLEPLLDTLAENGTLRIWLYPIVGAESAETLLEATRRMHVANRGWTEVVLHPLSNQRVDLEAEVMYLSSSSTGLQHSSSTDSFSKEILDCIEKKKEKVKVDDSTWVEKIVEIKHYITIYAEVTTHTESIEVTARGKVAVYLPGAENPLWEKRLRAGADWSDSYTTCSGDSRALPSGSCSGSSIVHRPSEWRLIDRAVRKLPRRASGALFRHYAPPPVPKGRLFWPDLSL